MPFLTRRLAFGLIAAATAVLPALPASAQTKLKWAHVYETSEPFHTQSVWAAQEIAKRTNNRYQIDVYPASQLGKESDINQGLSLGTVDMIISGPSFAARSYPPIGIGYYPYIFRDAAHLLAFAKSDVFKDLSAGYADKTGHQMVALTYYLAVLLTTILKAVQAAGVPLDVELVAGAATPFLLGIIWLGLRWTRQTVIRRHEHDLD